MGQDYYYWVAGGVLACGAIIGTSRYLNQEYGHLQRPVSENEKVPVRYGTKVAIIGGSITGMTAAKALSKYYDQVVIFDKDDIEVDEKSLDLSQRRRPVQQYHFLHTLLTGGAKVLEQYFPDVFQDLVTLKLLEVSTFFMFGDILCSVKGFDCTMCRRHDIEIRVRKSLRALLPGLRIHYATEAETVFEKRNGKLTAVSVNWTSQGKTEKEDFDLVVDCTGRNSKIQTQLEKAGVSGITNEIMTSGFKYCQWQITNLDDPSLEALKPHDFSIVLSIPSPNLSKHIMYLFPTYVDGKANSGDLLCGSFKGDLPDTYEQCVNEYLKDSTISGTSAFNNYFRKLIPSEQKPNKFAYDKALWKHFEHAKGFPDNFVVLGDAVCSFNPMFGQGMSSGAAQAKMLDDALAQQGSPKKLQLALDKVRTDYIPSYIFTPWYLSTTVESMFPTTTGDITLLHRILQPVIVVAVKAMVYSPAITKAFMGCQQLRKHLFSFFDPLLVPPLVFYSIAYNFWKRPTKPVFHGNPQ